LLIVALAVLGAFQQAAGSPHPCVGDFVYRPGSNEVGIGVRARRNPDHVEILFSDHGGVDPTSVIFGQANVRVTDRHDGSELLMTCVGENFTLTLPADEYSDSRTYALERANGSVYEIGEREGWYVPH
jgi:hypothetical protein